MPTVAYGANSILRHASIAVDVHVSAEKGRHLLVRRINSILMLAICHLHSAVHCQTTLCLKNVSFLFINGTENSQSCQICYKLLVHFALFLNCSLFTCLVFILSPDV